MERVRITRQVDQAEEVEEGVLGLAADVVVDVAESDNCYVSRRFILVSRADKSGQRFLEILVG